MKKTDIQECKLKGMLEYYFDKTIIYKTDIYSYGKLL